MAVYNQVETLFGENRTLYIRLNDVEAANHGVSAAARFRGFNSLTAWQDGRPFMWEKVIEFPADVSGNLWQQAYSALKSDPAFAEAEDA